MGDSSPGERSAAALPRSGEDRGHGCPKRDRAKRAATAAPWLLVSLVEACACIGAGNLTRVGGDARIVSSVGDTRIGSGVGDTRIVSSVDDTRIGSGVGDTGI